MSDGIAKQVLLFSSCIAMVYHRLVLASFSHSLLNTSEVYLEDNRALHAVFSPTLELVSL